MKGIIVLTLISLVISLDPDAQKSFCELVHSRGFLCQQHWIATDDEYILQLFRIPGKFNEEIQQKPVVFLQHGLMDSSDTYVYNDEQNALGTWLADKGYDVWLGNNRGNKYSNKHMTLETHFWNKDYWSFSFMHFSQYDVPAMINYVIAQTKQEKIAWIGQSQGTSQLFAALSDPLISSKVEDKVALFISLNPVLNLTHCSFDIFDKFAKYNAFNKLEDIKVYELFSLDPELEKAIAVICNYFTFLCKGVDYIAADVDPNTVNWDRMPVILAHYPAGTSTMSFDHFGQEIVAAQFQKYDYGSELNQKIYNSEKPPIYDISKIKVPMAWFAGGLDRLANITDVRVSKQLLEETNPGKLIFYKEVQKYGHAGFIWGSDCGEVYFKDVQALLDKFI